MCCCVLWWLIRPAFALNCLLQTEQDSSGNNNSDDDPLALDLRSLHVCSALQMLFAS